MSGRYEDPDPTPVAVPLRYKRPPTLQEQIQRLIRSEAYSRRMDEGYESLEEADDFDVGDDFDSDPHSPWEDRADHDFDAVVSQAQPAKDVGEGGSKAPPKPSDTETDSSKLT